MIIKEQELKLLKNEGERGKSNGSQSNKKPQFFFRQQ